MITHSIERKGLILAAGYGSRLAGVSSVTSFKPLTPIAGKPLIIRTIDSLAIAGCSTVIIVLGHGYEKVKEAILNSYVGSINLEFVYNDKYELSNGISVLAAAESLGKEFIMTMADHILDDSLMEIARNYTLDEGHAALLVDYKLNTIFDMEDATKVWSERDKVIHIGKHLKEFNCIDTGVFVCTKGLLSELKRYFDEHGDVSISNGVQELAIRGHMYTVDVGNGFWQDVDTAEMFAFAEKKLVEG